MPFLHFLSTTGAHAGPGTSCWWCSGQILSGSGSFASPLGLGRCGSEPVDGPDPLPFGVTLFGAVPCSAGFPSHVSGCHSP